MSFVFSFSDFVFTIKSFNFKEAAHILVQDSETLAEACHNWSYPAGFFLWTAYEQVLDEDQAAIAKRIGERLQETMPTEQLW